LSQSSYNGLVRSHHAQAPSSTPEQLNTESSKLERRMLKPTAQRHQKPEQLTERKAKSYTSSKLNLQSRTLKAHELKNRGPLNHMFR